jgi:hypothetical protein
MTVYSVDKLMAEARRLAAEYRRMTGKTLPISGEIAVNDAVRLLGLETVNEQGLGFDALRGQGDGAERLQIKARVVFDEIKSSHRIGELKMDRAWDAVLLVLLDENYETFAIYEARRAAIEAALEDVRPNKRGTLTVPRFQRIGSLVWSRPLPAVPAAGTASA